MLKNRAFRPADGAFWAAWLGLLAAFVALCIAVYREHPLAFDMRVTLWVQDLERLPCVPQFFAFANAAGDANRVAALAAVLFVALLLMRMRFEAAVVGGVIAVRLLQLAIRETVDWPAGQAEYFVTHRALPDGGSFLSGHVLGQVLVYGLLFAYAPRLCSSSATSVAAVAVVAVRVFCALVIVLGGAARLYVGAHWPSDIIGSAMLAALYLMLALWLDARRGRRMETPSETQSHRDTEADGWVAMPGRATPL